ncbi:MULTISPECIES: AraD1 family protein [Pseudomonadota]|uniref:AraD1 family protein n=1 Tax=Pseudomonadota TaxID=1224 RepID=UPI003A8FF4D0
MRIVQLSKDGQVRVAVVEDADTLRLLRGDGGVYALAHQAISQKKTLVQIVEEAPKDGVLDYANVLENGKLLPPFTHPDESKCLVSGTGLTHLGSADTRSAMHQKIAQSDENLTDSMRMFRMGLEAGKPDAGQVGAQPEWFYKGDGSIVVAPEQPIPVPSFAKDAGEEPELVGLYVIGDDGAPYRVGFAIGNEFSDHVTERANYLWLAHSKLRACSFGPELLLENLPNHLEGQSSVHRGDDIIWSKPFLTGEANMAHTISNLEHHHFKYSQFRRPGDVHVHFFGTATLSHADGVQTVDGDVFEIALPAFGRALRNPLKFSKPEISSPEATVVQSL